MNYVKINYKIAFEIQFQRDKKNLTQADLAENTGTTIDIIKKIETNRVKNVSYDLMKNIYDFLELDNKNLISNQKSKYHFNLTKNESLILEMLMNNENLLSKNEAISFLIDRYSKEISLENSKVFFENIIIRSIDSYMKSVMIPLLIEYKVDENILKRIEEDIDTFDLSQERAFAKNDLIMNSFENFDDRFDD
jgi:transcriptional regulator with XRE-family HTH domain